MAFATRQRQAALTADALRLVEGAMREAAQRSRADITDFTGHPDHVRAVLRYPADLAASHLVRRLKSASARALREEGPSRVWAPSFFLASIGAASADGIDEYVREQEQVINS